jgi:hypothetical protein
MKAVLIRDVEKDAEYLETATMGEFKSFSDQDSLKVNVPPQKCSDDRVRLTAYG